MSVAEAVVSDRASEGHDASIVRGFLEAIGATRDGWWRCFDYFDDETVWEMVGVGSVVGKAACIEFASAFPVKFDYMDVVDLHITEAGGSVFAELVERFMLDDGTVNLTIRALAVFEVEGDTIKVYRDYYDTASTNQRIGELAAAAG